MTSDPRVKAYLVNTIAYGLKTVVTEEELDVYCCGLVEFINAQEIPAWVDGDRDGILVTNAHGDAKLIILPKVGITTFRILGEFEVENQDFAETCFRVVLAVIGWTVSFSPGEKIVPAGGLSVGDSEEEVFDFKDDGFGIA
jgi:hypothetical protein